MLKKPKPKKNKFHDIGFLITLLTIIMGRQEIGFKIYTFFNGIKTLLAKSYIVNYIGNFINKVICYLSNLFKEVNMGGLVWLIVAVVIIVLIVMNIRIVPQANAYVIERLGGYLATWDVGLHVKVPFIDVVRVKVSLKERVVDFPPQPVITKDNVSMNIDTVVYYQVTDPKAYAYGVANPLMAIENLTATTLRNIIGQLELDESLTSRDHINSQMRVILDEATDPWGIKVNRVEVKNILPPQDIQEAMEKQMRAERERRRAILEAEGQKKASILEAEGERESRILKAEGEKQAAILAAEGKKEAEIRMAEGKAQAIKTIQEAEAYGIQQINEAKPEKAVLAIKSFETMEKVAQGNATKIIIPSEIQNLAGMTKALKEL